MDSSATYLAQSKDVNDGAKTTVESPDEEIVVFANGNSNGIKSANKVPAADGKVASGPSDAGEAGDSAKADGTVSTPTGPADNDSGNGLADAFNKLSVNTKPDAKFDYGGLNEYRAPAKYPTISVSPHADVNGSAGVEWQHQQPPKTGHKPGDEQSYGGAPLYGRPMNPSASDFQHRGAPTPAAYPGYGAPGAAYGSYQGAPQMHGGYVNHGYDVFGLSPTLTEPSVAGGAPNPANTNGSNASANRYAPRNSVNGNDPNGMGLNLNGLGANAGGPAPYSPIPLSPSPLSLNPYAAHHHQMQINAHMNGLPMGGYMPPPPAGPGKTDPNSASGMGGTPAANGANGANNGSGPGANGNARGYAPPTQAFNVPPMPYGVSPGQQYYDESAMYANAYGAPHLQHGMPHGVHPQYQMNHQMGPPHPGTPQLGGYGGYMPGPMVGVPAPGMVPVPGAGGPAAQNGAPQGNGSQGGIQQGTNANGASNGSGQTVTSVVNGLTLINGVPQPNADGTGPSANNRKLGLYKTELCRSWEEKGSCRYGPKCQFAHGEDEIRKVARHPKYKTEICRTFWLSGSCPYGKRCCFIHTDAPANANGAETNKAGAGTGPSTAAAGTVANGQTTSTNPTVDGAATPGHTRTTSNVSEANNEQPPSSLLARISAKRAGEGEKTPSPQGPPRIASNATPRPDFSHNRHLSSMSDGRPNDSDAVPSFNPRPGHSHSASAHTLMTPTFTSPSNGGLGFGSSSTTPTAVDGNGNLTPGSYWGHKRSASGGSATNGGWNTSGTESPAGTQPEQPLRSIYSSLTPTA